MKSGSRILIVDDDDDFRETLASVLRGHGYLVSEATDGEEAIAALTHTVPDMAIFDLDMPKLNGLAFSKKVKDAAPDFPVVMVTGHDEQYSSAEILSVGIDVFLQKPVPMEKMLEVVQTI